MKRNTEINSREDRINQVLAHMRHKDLQRACVLKGLEFENIVNWDHHKLSNWFFKNFDNGEDPKKLDEYDSWVEKKLQERGYKKGDAVFAPCFRFGFSPEISDIPILQTPGVAKSETPIKEISDKPKSKRMVDETTGVYSGTKKNLTYTLTRKGMEFEQILSTVMEQFPEAQEKSVKIWHKRCLKEMKDESHS